MSSRTGVYLEVGARRVFASAADWPGWSRGGKNEKEALQALAAYAPRYARVVKLPKDATDFDIIERQKGNAAAAATATRCTPTCSTPSSHTRRRSGSS